MEVNTYADAVEILKSSPYFDEEWYVQEYHDVKILSMDPVEHYLNYGVLLRRDPGPAFSTFGYLKAFPDIQEARLNPLYHYIKWGKEEGRDISFMESKGVWQGSSGGSGNSIAPYVGDFVVDRNDQNFAQDRVPLDEELAVSKRICEDLKDENSRLQLQLHQTQEELESYFIKYMELNK